MTEKHSIEFPPQQHAKSKDVDAEKVAREFLPKLQAYLQDPSNASISDVFQEESWMRDALCFDWDLRTRHGKEQIKSYVEASSLRTGFDNLKTTAKFPPRVLQPSPQEDLEWVEFSIAFETDLARGKGMVRLTQDNAGLWKCYLLYTAVEELKGFEELKGARRPHGGRNTLTEGSGGNWLEQRHREIEFRDQEPTVLIIGAGQAGLAIGARLKALKVTSLLIDRNERVGDNWRHRYRTLSTHDPVHTCHMPYIPFPPTWSFFSPKDKLADFLEAYASLMELNVWLKTSLDGHPVWDDSQKVWTAKLKRSDGEIREFHPRHIVFCTGHSGEPKIPSFPGQESFKGIVYHGSQHKDASQMPDVTGRNVIVVGTGNSGHDIAQNFYDHGANVTMIQRSNTYIIGADVGLIMLTEALYGEDSPDVEDADLYAQSYPWPVTFRFYRDATSQIAEAEKELRDGLEKAGFGLTMGIGGGGIFRNYLTRGGGYYIDVGCSAIIARGDIKIEQSPDGITGFDQSHLKLASGKDLPADIVVLATGYDNMRTSLRKAFGDKVADQCKDVWGLDDEGELNAMWRNSGHPGLWYMGGNLSLCRTYSKYLALQIKATEEGLMKDPANKKGALDGITGDLANTTVNGSHQFTAQH